MAKSAVPAWFNLKPISNPTTPCCISQSNRKSFKASGPLSKERLVKVYIYLLESSSPETKLFPNHSQTERQSPWYKGLQASKFNEYINEFVQWAFTLLNNYSSSKNGVFFNALLMPHLHPCLVHCTTAGLLALRFGGCHFSGRCRFSGRCCRRCCTWCKQLTPKYS